MASVGENASSPAVNWCPRQDTLVGALLSLKRRREGNGGGICDAVTGRGGRGCCYQNFFFNLKRTLWGKIAKNGIRLTLTVNVLFLFLLCFVLDRDLG